MGLSSLLLRAQCESHLLHEYHALSKWTGVPTRQIDFMAQLETVTENRLDDMAESSRSHVR